MKTSWILFLAGLIGVVSTTQVLAAPTPLPVTPLPVSAQKTLSVIPLGTEASFLIMPSLSSGRYAFVQENQEVVLPIAGKIGDSDIPKDSMLIGTFKRIDDKSGTFEFYKLALGTQVYAVKMTSEVVNGQLMADPQGTQAMRANVDELKAAMAPQIAKAEQGQNEFQSQQNAAMASMGTQALLGMVTGGELVSGAAQVAEEAAAKKDLADQKAAAASFNAAMQNSMQNLQTTMAQNPPKLFAQITSQQRLRIKFLNPVDLKTPVASLPTPMTAQGILTQPN